MDFPIKNGDFPRLYVKLPEGSPTPPAEHFFSTPQRLPASAARHPWVVGEAALAPMGREHSGTRTSAPTLALENTLW